MCGVHTGNSWGDGGRGEESGVRGGRVLARFLVMDGLRGKDDSE